MKKFSFFLMLSVAICAQSFAQVKFGVKAGATLSNFHFSSDDVDSDELSSRVSFYAGATADIPVDEIVTFQPGLVLMNKGITADASGTLSTEYDEINGQTKGKVAPIYLEVPLMILFNFNIGKGKLLLGAGPYYAMGIAGRIKSERESSRRGTALNGRSSESYNESIRFGNTAEDNLKIHEFGLNGTFGYQFDEHFGIQAAYGYGLSNVSTNANFKDSTGADIKTTNRVFSAGLFYKF